MVKKKVDARTKALMEFFESMGAKFIDFDSGERIEPYDNSANDGDEEDS